MQLCRCKELGTIWVQAKLLQTEKSNNFFKCREANRKVLKHPDVVAIAVALTPLHHYFLSSFCCLGLTVFVHD
jgi:hypothetical protein